MSGEYPAHGTGADEPPEQTATPRKRTATPTDRSLAARLAVHTSWANTENRAARTAAARKAASDRFAKQVDPDGVLPPEERARRAEHARKAHMARMSLLAAQARRSRKSA